MTVDVLDARTIGAEASTDYERLLAALDKHRLRDSRFRAARWLDRHAEDAWIRLVACQHDGSFVGFLAGMPATGHVSIVGTLNPGRGVGSALLTVFSTRAAEAGASRLTVSLDTEPAHRINRRRFFAAHGFTSVQNSAIHLAAPLEVTSPAPFEPEVLR
ncbi:GNAT family N-acetyltransferase [Nocardia sp. alder85J]|uniref:GNAT family N-acetyltransferase n=1 Tax=Nocardia sp. alder85J TaxID=2862949 RepID=UPI001CD27F5D|nr:GNAT family N-acetyltransferase [Nocardia sp. alder85J]MCX4097708.1 GNAT family N-acetyltransferase [Nocardia sp. alder85J]